MTIRDLLKNQARQKPDACAVSAPAREPLTFSRLEGQLDYVVAALNRSGVGQGDRVALVLPNGPEMAVAFVAVASGATCAPLNPAYGEREFEFYLGDLDARAVIVQSGFASPVRKVAQALAIPIIELVVDSNAPAGVFTLESLAEATATRPGFSAPGDAALILHTSGTTARPKMTLLTQANLVASARNVGRSLELVPGDRCLNVMPLFHIHGLVGALLSSLGTGAEVVCMPGFDVASFFDALGLLKPTWYSAVPTMHQAILARAAQYPDIVAASRLRFIRSSSSALAPSVMAELEQVFRAPVIEAYGMTEAAHQMASNPLPPRPRKPGSVGLAAGPEVTVLDEETLAPLAAGEIGELAIRGPNVTGGYVENPAANETAFVNGWFRTGDQGYIDSDGYVFITGRLKEMINRGGQKIAPREIDEVLMAHPDVVQAVAFATAHASLGEDVAAAVVLGAGSGVSEADLRTFAFSHLADYKVPSRIVIVDAIPKGPTGKLQRIGLSEQLAAQLETEFAAPTSPVEEALVQFWVEVLGNREVGVADNFFWIGGDSITGAQLMARVNAAFQMDLPLATVFKYPTIASQAPVITGHLLSEIEGMSDSAQQMTGNTDNKDKASGLTPAAQAWLQQRVQRALAGNATSQTIPRRTATTPAPLSAAQKRMWIYQALHPGGLEAVRPVALRLTGPVDERGVAGALNEIVKRHEVLRSVYRLDADEPTQTVGEPQALPLPVVDLRAEHAESASAALQTLGIDTAARVIDLGTGPVIAATLVRLEDQEYRLLLMVHHIAFDGWSEAILIRELAQFYSQYLDTPAAALPELPVQLADFASWQHAQFGAGAVQQHVDYWKRKLEHMPPRLALSTDYVAAKSNQPKRLRRSFIIPLELTRQLEDLTRRENVTLFMVLVAAFQSLLYRYTRQDDITIGTIAAGRSQAELSDLIGCFISILPMRTDLSGDPVFRELLRRVRETTLEFHAHQNLPAEQLSELLSSEGHLGQSPIYQVLFQYRNFKQVRQIEAGDVLIERDRFHIEAATWLLSAEVSRADEGLHALFDFAADRFLPETAARMQGHYCTLLAAIAADPGQRVSMLPLLTDVERQQLLVEWNDTRVEFPTEKCVQQLFEEQVARTPDKVAVLATGRQLTYAELNARANQLARRLRQLGVARDVLVGFCVERSPEMLVGVLGILKAGGAYLPLDPAYPHDRLAAMIEDAGIPVLLTQDKLADRLPVFAGHLLRLDVDWPSIAELADDNQPGHAGTDNLAYVIYTSGSTGRPKGVPITHRAMTNLVCAAIDIYDINADDRIFQFASISFDAAVEEIYPGLIVGSTIVLRGDDDVLTAESFWRLCEERGITVAPLPTSFWHQLGLEMSGNESVLPRSLRMIIIGGEEARADAVQRWVGIAARSDRPPRLLNSYGPTETTVFVTSYELKLSGADTPRLPILPIGRPIANTTAYILDPHLQPVPVGVPGELHIGGVQVARGYLNRPDLSAGKFVRDPFSNAAGARLYRTGDLTRYLPDGNIEYLGRIDHQVKVRGYRIELQEIESLLKRHAAIRDAVVLAREDAAGNKQLVAWVIVHADQSASGAELRAALRRQLPEYMVPSDFVPLDKFPLTVTGKVDLRALPAPTTGSADLVAHYEPPVGDLESRLAEIWCSVLGKERVGRHDDIFDLGGHSLTLTRLAAQIQDNLGVQVPLTSLFDHRTIEQMAIVILEQLMELTVPP